MSRWTHGTVANSLRKSPLFTRPPSATGEALRKSAYQLSISGMYSSIRGICQKRSAARVPAARTSSTHGCGVPNNPVTRSPSARATAPVSVATSTMWVAPRRSA